MILAGKIVRYEFVGSSLYVFFCFLLVIGIPLGGIHLINCTVRIEEEMDNPNMFWEQHKARQSR
jgi:hypothetical protein